MSFRQIIVTSFAQELVQDLEAAHYSYAALDSKDINAVAQGYSLLCERRKALYNYIESLERGFTPPAYEQRRAVRFD